MDAKHTNTAVLSAYLNEKPQLPVKFYFDESPINPGYHITEVRHAAINSVDCGRHSDVEQWQEITIQLLDGSPNSLQGHMSAEKFLSIIGTATARLNIETAPYLFFEYAPNNGPIRKLRIESVSSTEDEWLVSLGNERAVCKPFERAVAAAKLTLPTATRSAKGGCCSGDTPSKTNSCC